MPRQSRMPRLTKTELKIIAQELDTSHKILPKIVQEKPWLTDISRQYLCAWGFCDKFPVFRTVGLMRLSVPEGEFVSPHIQAQVEASKELRPEAIVSTTLNPRVALSIAAEQADHLYWTGDMFRGGMLSTEPVILRYEVTLDRVILFVPALIAYIRMLYPAEELRKTRYRNRHGDLYSVPHIFRELEHREENEVIADVTGLKPEVLETSKHMLWDAVEIIRTPGFDPIEYMKRNDKWGVPPLPPGYENVPEPPPGPTKEQLKHLEWLKRLQAKLYEFFATPWRPMPRSAG